MKKISSKSIVLIKGQTKTLKIKGTSSTVKQSSSDKSVVTVTSKGKVTAKKKYTCKITVKKQTVQTSNYVWLSATGSKYHKIPNCGKMNPNNARKVKISDAKNQGYTACKKCF